MANIKLTANEDRFVQAMERAAGSVGKLSAMLNVNLAHAMRETDNLTRNFQKGFGALGDKIQNVGQNMSTYLTVPLALVGGAALKTYGEIDQLKKGLDSYKLSFSDVKTTAKLPGLGLEEVAQSEIKFASVKYNAGLAVKAVKEFGNALIASGKGKAELDGISNAFAQIKGKPSIMAQEVNQIAERLPMIRDLMQQAFGTSNTEVLQKQNIGAEAFLTKIVAQLEKLPRVAGGFKVGMENIADSLKVGAYEVTNIADKLFNLTGIANAVSDYIDSAVTAFQGLSPEIQKTIFVVGGLVAVAGPLITAFGFIVSTVVPAFITGIGTLFSPILAIAAVVAVVAANIIKYWDNIKNTLVNSGVWSGVAEVFKAGLQYIGDIVGVFISLFTADWEGLWENMKNIMKRVWNGIVEVFTFPLKTILQLQQSVFSSLGFDKLANGFGYALGVVNQLTNKIKADIPESTNNLKKLADAFNGLTGGKTTTGGVTVDNSKALKDLEKQREILGKLNINTMVSADVKGIDKLMNPEKYTKNLSWVDEMLAAGKRLSTEMPKVLSQMDLSQAGLTIEEQIRKNVADRAKLALMELNETVKNLNKQLVFDLITGSAEGIGDAIAQGIAGNGFSLGKVFQHILGTIGQYMIDLGKNAIIAKKMLDGLTLAFGGPATLPAALAVITGGGLLKGLAGSLFSQTPKFAQGGMVTGPTFAMMGDNASGREMALPWEKTSVFAEAIARNMSGGGGFGGGEFKIKIQGEDLYAIFTQHKRNNGIA